MKLDPRLSALDYCKEYLQARASLADRYSAHAYENKETAPLLDKIEHYSSERVVHDPHYHGSLQKSIREDHTLSGIVVHSQGGPEALHKSISKNPSLKTCRGFATKECSKATKFCHWKYWKAVDETVKAL